MRQPKRDGRSAHWRAENAGAIEAWNDLVEQEGVPLADYLRF
ncbi:type II toxin-antitoxin system CcdA family antitoxin [Sphingosinicella soli]